MIGTHRFITRHLLALAIEYAAQEKLTPSERLRFFNTTYSDASMEAARAACLKILHWHEAQPLPEKAIADLNAWAAKLHAMEDRSQC